MAAWLQKHSLRQRSNQKGALHQRQCSERVAEGVSKRGMSGATVMTVLPLQTGQKQGNRDSTVLYYSQFSFSAWWWWWWWDLAPEPDGSAPDVDFLRLILFPIVDGGAWGGVERRGVGESPRKFGKNVKKLMKKAGKGWLLCARLQKCKTGDAFRGQHLQGWDRSVTTKSHFFGPASPLNGSEPQRGHQLSSGR